jgi:hypothetical protein
MLCLVKAFMFGLLNWHLGENQFPSLAMAIFGGPLQTFVTVQKNSTATGALVGLVDE